MLRKEGRFVGPQAEIIHGQFKRGRSKGTYRRQTCIQNGAEKQYENKGRNRVVKKDETVTAGQTRKGNKGKIARNVQRSMGSVNL